VDTVTTHVLMKAVEAAKLDPAKLISHRFGFDRILEAYDTFARAAETRALKVVIAMPG
jgi:alcohol dehydrogenase